MYSKKCLDELKSKISLEDVLDESLPQLKRLVAYECPFHNHPGVLTALKGETHYHCYECGAHGDAIAFLMTHKKLSFTEAVECLAKKYDVKLEMACDATPRTPGEILKDMEHDAIAIRTLLHENLRITLEIFKSLKSTPEQ